MTRKEILDMISLYKKAEKAALSSKSYTINGRTLSRQNLPEIREGRQEWEQRLADFDMRQRGSTNGYAVADWQ